MEHVTKVANYASARYGVKPIIWDDMLRNFMEVGTFVSSMASEPVEVSQAPEQPSRGSLEIHTRLVKSRIT